MSDLDRAAARRAKRAEGHADPAASAQGKMAVRLELETYPACFAVVDPGSGVVIATGPSSVAGAVEQLMRLAALATRVATREQLAEALGARLSATLLHPDEARPAAALEIPGGQ